MSNNKSSNKIKRRLRNAAIFIACFFALASSLFFANAKINQDKILKGVKIGNINIGGKTIAEVQNILKQSADNLKKNLQIEFDGQRITIEDELFFDIEATVQKAASIGNNGNFVQNLFIKIKIPIFGLVLTPEWIIDENQFKQTIANSFSIFAQAPQNARFSIVLENGQSKIEVAPEVSGFIFNQEQAKQDLKSRLVNFSTEPIVLQKFYQEPQIKASDLQVLMPKLAEFFEQPELVLQHEAKTWAVSKDNLKEWLQIEKTDGIINLTFNKTSLEVFLRTIAKEVDIYPRNAIFNLNDAQSRVTKFQPARAGQEILIEENVENLLLWLENKINKTQTGLSDATSSSSQTEGNFILAAKQTLPTIPTEQSNTLGIKERVGIGKTNFKGSPANRVKNIKRGAELLNGILIKPEEEFSLLARLSPFTEENGYLKELVIKPAEGRTVPEIGGGLCQIGTTMFRVALDAGLPITARQNHSYRVSYYEPPVGMDATIYDPWPDFKFINDTGGHLLLLTFIEGYDLIFELWGERDGRKVEISTPVVYNIVQPPAKKIIETDELKPGEVKCTEKAHIGSDAKFTYKVTYPDGRIEEKEFKSRYRPWQEVCLVGVEKIDEEHPDEPALPAESEPQQDQADPDSPEILIIRD